jgi:adenylate cyclase class IV
MVGQTRVHCDLVDGLGEFIELEVVLADDEDENKGVEIANDLMDKLGVDKEKDLLSGAYMDMILDAEKK